jgi:hypothetical protein
MKVEAGRLLRGLTGPHLVIARSAGIDENSLSRGANARAVEARLRSCGAHALECMRARVRALLSAQ